MIAGLGLDLVEVSRVRAARTRWGGRFLEKVFTPGEIEACGGRADQDQALAARFAAKEAAMKALQTGWAEGVSWRDLEVVSARGRPPELVLSGGAAAAAARLGATRAHLSLTHERGVAAAVVILES